MLLVPSGLRRTPALLIVCAALLAACGPTVDEPDQDGDGGSAVVEDGAQAEAGEPVDGAPTQDASSEATADDASDARTPMDAPADAPPDAARTDSGSPDGASPDGAGPAAACTIRGVPGVCIATTDCTGGQITLAGQCPGAASVQCCAPPDPAWCPANGMPLPNEGLVEEPGVGGCPPGMLRVGTFCVDRFEASLEVVHPDGTTASWSPYWSPVRGQRYRAVSLRGAVPQGHISGTQAAAACSEAGKRLCSDSEWLRACQGPSHNTYPYGNTRMPGVCNDARSRHPAIECFNSSADWIWSDLEYAGINQQANSLARTDANPGCVSPEGPVDMMGNLHEWTSDPAGTFRGGYYVDTAINGNGCLYATTAHDMGHSDYSTGFRCCATP